MPEEAGDPEAEDSEGPDTPPPCDVANDRRELREQEQPSSDKGKFSPGGLDSPSPDRNSS